MADVNIVSDILIINPIEILGLTANTNSCNIISPIMNNSNSIEIPECRVSIAIKTKSFYL